MKKRTNSTGLLHLIFPAILLLVGAEVALSNRDLAQQFSELASVAGPPGRHPLIEWMQRAVSLLLLFASVEQIVNHESLGRRVPSHPLLWVFVVYWISVVGLPALWGANPFVSHLLFYSLAVGVACCMVGTAERDRMIGAARDGLMVLMLAGVLFIPIRLNTVMDMSYSQGVIPGLPRFAGLTAHPVTQGMLALVGLLLVWFRPYERRWLNRMAWGLGLFVLFIAQSKTSWASFLACAGCVLAVRHGPGFWKRMGDPRGSGMGVLVCLGIIVVVLAISSWILLGDAGGQIEDFTHSRKGAELMTLTGRDRIWAVAIEEWRNYPVFGYGHTIWDAAYRASIGMPNATHGHNQFMDDLARAGSIGAGALVIYVTVLLAMSLRYARASQGLSLGLFVALAVRSISEVPLFLVGYTTELFTHLLLLATLAAAASTERRTAQVRTGMRYGVASS